jgi:SAM-dependent methyltransferase
MGDAEHAFRSFLRWTIEVEWPAHAAFLPAGEREAFADYYKSLPHAGDEAAIERFLRGYWRSEAGWSARWISARAAARPGPVRVMDAGSGFGTFAMLYAAAGAEVIAADLRPDRLHAADLRIEFHARQNGRRLAVRQLRADLTKPWQDDVDLVWVYNALSHIDPLEGFLAEVCRRLRPGGVLVIGDINGSHPAHLARLAELRTEVHQEYVAPDGTRHAYAVERTFPPRELREIMRGNGLRVVHHELYWGGMGVLPGPLYALLRLLQTRWSLGHGRARRQLLVATPARGAVGV